MEMFSGNGEVGDFSMNSNQVNGNSEIGIAGASICDLFGYSREFEHQLQLEMQPDNFKLTSLLDESDNDNAYLELQESLEPQNLSMVHDSVPSFGDVMMQDLIPNQNLNMVHNSVSSFGDVMMQGLTPNQNLNMVPNSVPSFGDVMMQDLTPFPIEAQDHVFSYGSEDLVYNGETFHTFSPLSAIYSKDEKPRLQWTPELHACFVRAVEQLGGSKKATPRAIQHLMNVQGLSHFHVKSHLQKYRQGKHSVGDWIEISKSGKNASASLVIQGPSNSLTSSVCHVTNSPGNSLTSSDSLVTKGPSISLSWSPITANKRSNSKGKKVQKDKGSLYMEMQSEQKINRFQAAQRYYLNLAMENACKKLANRNLGSATIGSSNYLGEVTNSGTVAPLQTFYHQQPNTCSSMEAIGGYTSIQQQQNNFPAPTASCYQNMFPPPLQSFSDTHGQSLGTLDGDRSWPYFGNEF